MRAADNNVNILARDCCVQLVEIEIIAGKEGKAYSFDLGNVWLVILEGVIAVELHFRHLTGGQMLFIVDCRFSALAVINDGGIAVIIADGIVIIDSDHRVSATRCILRLFAKLFHICIDRSEHFIAAFCQCGHVTAFRKYNEIEPFLK